VGCSVMGVADGGPTLLERIEAYLAKHELAPTKFGKLTVGSPSLLTRMRAGKTLRRGSIERVEAMLAGPPIVLTPRSYKSRRYRVATAEQIRFDMMERDRRLSDPFEQAANVLRRTFKPVVRARVYDPEATGWMIGHARVDDEEFLARARRAGWEG
jgi:hypothetical protein